QSAQLPPLAAVARHCGAGADRSGRPARSEPLCHRRRRRTCVLLRAPTRIGGKEAAGTKAASLDLPPWAQVATILDSAARGTGLPMHLKLLTSRAYLSDPAEVRRRGARKERKENERKRTPVHPCNWSGRTSRARIGPQNAP